MKVIRKTKQGNYVLIELDGAVHHLPYAAFQIIFCIQRDDPILIEALAEEGFNGEDDLLKYEELNNQADQNELNDSDPEDDFNSTEESVRAEEDPSEVDCLVIILDPYNEDHFTEVQDKIIHKPYYQTEIQKDDIILIVIPEIMSQIQKKMYYFKNHAVPDGI